tara:strand:- start:1286 stop:2029 length:744 start_codon:yes stop_codon:yes gene_type:complete
MNRVLLVTALSGLLAVLAIFGTSAQNAGGDPFFYNVAMQVKPGQLQAFEEARGRWVAHRQEHGYPWRENVAITAENNIVRISTRLDNGWDDVAARREWVQNTPRANSGMAATVDFLGSEIGQGLPELSYIPENPRFTGPEEVGFVRELRILPHPGAGAAVRQFLADLRDAQAEADSDQPRFVGRTLIGRDTFGFGVLTPARDIGDSYAAREALQPIISSLSGLQGNIRRFRVIHWIPRPDLSYVPED